MNLIALRGFKNNAKDQIEFAKDVDVLHEHGVHKGARFSIGGDKPFKEIRERKLQDLIATLNHAECIGDAGDSALCKRIDEEVKVEARQRKEATTSTATGSTAEVARAVIAALQELNAVKAPKASQAAVGA